MEHGNTFDHIASHGALLDATGYAFDSATNDAFGAGLDGEWWMIDWIAGRQKTTPPPAGLPGEGNPDRMETEFEVLTDAQVRELARHMEQGAALLMSGAHIAEDLLDGPEASAEKRAFLERVFGVSEYQIVENKRNTVDGGEGPGVFHFGQTLDYTINLNDPVIGVPRAESYGDASEDALFSYMRPEGAASALEDKALLVGFPLETVVPAEAREAVFRKVMDTMR